MSSSDGVVGRRHELATAAAAVRSLGEGRASALVIQGEAGIGKTRLVQAVEQVAHAHRVIVVHGRGHVFERTRPFGLVTEALEVSVSSPDPRRAGLAALLTRGVSDGDATTGDLHHQVLDRVVDLVETTCADRPLLLVAEDIHWADPASLAAISAVVRRMPYSPVLVAVTLRPSPRSAVVSRLLDDLAAVGAPRSRSPRSSATTSSPWRRSTSMPRRARLCRRCSTRPAATRSGRPRCSGRWTAPAHWSGRGAASRRPPRSCPRR